MLTSYRQLPGFFAVTAALTLLVIAGAYYGGNPNPPLVYLILLLFVCCSPLLLANRLNGAHAILLVLMAVFFADFWLGDFLDLWDPGSVGASGVLITSGRAATLLGALLLVIGYQAAYIGWKNKWHAPLRDWPSQTTLVLGVMFTAGGLVATWYWQVIVFRYAFAELHIGGMAAVLVTFGRSILPLGLLILAYRVVASPSKGIALLMAAVVLGEFYVGFVGDSKEMAFQGVAVLLLTKALVGGRVPKMWLLASTTIVVLGFPIFYAYRGDVLGPGVVRSEAAQQFGKNLAKAFSSAEEKAKQNDREVGLRSFISRSSLISNMELITQRTGKDVPYQKGYTLLLFFNAFVPRLLWPDKPDNSVGQLFNRQFHISDFPDVYISPGFLGDFYWNFGWIGVIVGMGLFGYLLGVVGCACDLSQSRSLTKLLVLGITCYTFCLRFEDGFAMEATIWIRALIVIGLLHAIFARRAHSARQGGHFSSTANQAEIIPFQNLMR